MTSPSVLLVDGGQQPNRVLSRAFKDASYQVHTSTGGTDGLIEIGRMAPDVIVMIWPLPDIDSLEFVRGVRRVSLTPMIALSPEVDEDAMLGAFEAGVDSFTSMPEDARLVVARSDALLRLAGPQGPQLAQVLDSERQLVLDEGAGQVYLGDDPVELTATEYNLLVELATEPGRLVTREELAHRVWEDNGERDARLIDPHMSRLRGKLEVDAANPDLIRTVRGRGYRFDIK